MHPNPHPLRRSPRARLPASLHALPGNGFFLPCRSPPPPQDASRLAGLAEVDFGRLGLVHDPETGRRRVLHALIVTLVHSRHQGGIKVIKVVRKPRPGWDHAREKTGRRWDQDREK